jgi:hypothetical protein
MRAWIAAVGANRLAGFALVDLITRQDFRRNPLKMGDDVIRVIQPEQMGRKTARRPIVGGVCWVSAIP